MSFIQHLTSDEAPHENGAWLWRLYRLNCCSGPAVLFLIAHAHVALWTVALRLGRVHLCVKDDYLYAKDGDLPSMPVFFGKVGVRRDRRHDSTMIAG